jgi:hypothetical protein
MQAGQSAKRKRFPKVTVQGQLLLCQQKTFGKQCHRSDRLGPRVFSRGTVVRTALLATLLQDDRTRGVRQRSAGKRSPQGLAASAPLVRLARTPHRLRPRAKINPEMLSLFSNLKFVRFQPYKRPHLHHVYHAKTPRLDTSFFKNRPKNAQNLPQKKIIPQHNS